MFKKQTNTQKSDYSMTGGTTDRQLTGVKGFHSRFVISHKGMQLSWSNIIIFKYRFGVC